MARKSKHRQQIEAFEVWYALDRDFNQTLQKLAENEEKAPSLRTLYLWAEQLGWIAKADGRDKVAEERAAKEAIKRKAAMLKRHSEMGRVLQNAGLRYFDSHNKQVETGQQAISAISKGVEIERTSEGLPAWIVDLLAASDDDLIQQYRNLLEEIGRNRGGTEPPGDNATDTSD